MMRASNDDKGDGSSQKTTRNTRTARKGRRRRNEGGDRLTTLMTSPLKRSKSRRKAPSTVSTAHSDVFNAPIPDDDDMSYTDLFKKYKSHVAARAHLSKIEHSRIERAARNFEEMTNEYATQQNDRITGRHAKSHGEMSKDEGGFRIPMQPRVSPVKRMRALAMGERVLRPGELPVVPSKASDDLEGGRITSFTNNVDVDPAKKQRARRKRERRERREQAKRTESPTMTMPLPRQQNKSNGSNENVEDDDEGANAPRAPFAEESLDAYNFHLGRHSERREKRRKDRKEREAPRSSTSLAREWKRGRRQELAAKKKAAREKREAKLLAEGINPDDIPEMYDDGKLDHDGWLKRNRPLRMSAVERQCLHHSFDSSTEGVVDVSSQRIQSLASDIGKSTLQLQLGFQVIQSLGYSANHFHGKELPVDDILALTFNQTQRSAKQARRTWRERKSRSGRLEELYFAQCGLASIPDNLGLLTGLIVLDLHSNRLTEVPDELVQLVHLKRLYLHANRIGKLPANFGALKSLEELDVSQNIIAYLPDGIHKCTKLRHIKYNANRVMVMGIFPVPTMTDETVKSWDDDDVWEKVDGQWWGCVYKNIRTGTMKRKPPTGATVVNRVLSMRDAKTWGGELNDLANTVKKRDKSLNFNKLKEAGAPMHMLRLALRNTNSSEWEVGIDTNGDTYYETCLKDPGKYGEFKNRQYDMPMAMDRIGKLMSMQTLHMSLNGVRTIPDSIGTGPLQATLRELHLEFNKIRDLPNTLSKLRCLEELYLGNNMIEKLPKDIGGCLKLRVLRLQFNKLKYLPKSIGNCRNLEVLWLNNNFIRDFPLTMGNCPLEDIKAKNNDEELNKRFVWSEGTPSILYELRRRLSVSISGAPPSVELVGMGVNDEVLIPRQRHQNIIRDRCLEVAMAAENDTKNGGLQARKRAAEKKAKEKNRHQKKGEEILLEPPDDEFDHLTINFNWMGLTEIPPELIQLKKKLRILRMVGNKIPSIPTEALAPLGGLLKLNLNANGIESLPDVFGKMRFLQELHLAENKLVTIPHSVMRLKNLQILDAAHNKIVTLSSAIGRLRGILELNFASNVLEDLPKEIGEAVTLRKIDLSHNRLRLIPEEAGNLFRLRKLNLNFNKLSKVPASFGNLSSLRELLLCRNRIRSLPKSLAAVVDVEAEYEKLADNKTKNDPAQEETMVVGSGMFAEKFVRNEYEERKEGKDGEDEKDEEENEEDDGKEVDGGGGGSPDSKWKRSWSKRTKANKTASKAKGDASSPYMLLTGVVSSAIEEGMHVAQRQQLWYEPNPGGFSGGSESEGEAAPGPTFQIARGVVCEILSSSSLVVRVTTMGARGIPSILFVPGVMLRTKEEATKIVGGATTSVKLGVPKTATQHQHVVLTFAPEDTDGEGEEAVVDSFLTRLDRSAWLEQHDTGAVGKVVAAVCLRMLPDLPELLETLEAMGGAAEATAAAAEAAAAAASEGKEKKSDKRKRRESKADPFARDKPEEAAITSVVAGGEETLELNEEEEHLESTIFISVVVLLLSRDAMFNAVDPLTIYSDVPLPILGDDVSLDGEIAAARHLVPPPMHVSTRVREMCVSGPEINVPKDDDDEVVERGRIIMQSSPLDYAPPTVCVTSMRPLFGLNKDNQSVAAAMAESGGAGEEKRGVNKEHRAKLKVEREERKKIEESIVRISVLVIAGRPMKNRKMYLCEEERPRVVSLSEMELGTPELTNKESVPLDPTRLARIARSMGVLASRAGRAAKRGALKILEKAVGPERALEIEERTQKNYQLAAARAIMLQQAAKDRSIAISRGMAASAHRMAKASANMRKEMRNRLIETVTGKFQLDDVSEDSDDQPRVMVGGEEIGEGGVVLKSYSQDFKGMLVGGMRALEKDEVHMLMQRELDEYQEKIREIKEQEEKDKLLGKKKKKKKKKSKKNETAVKDIVPMSIKPSPLANALVVLRLSANKLTEVPETFSHFNVMKFMSVDQNPILSPPSVLANMGIQHIRAYFELRTLRVTQLKNELSKRGVQFHEDRMSPHAERVIAKESRGHLTKHDLTAFDAQVDKLVNGQIVLFRYTAKKIVKNLIRVAAKRQHWYHQKILCEFVKLLEVVELESLAFPNAFVSKKMIRPWGDGMHPTDVRVFIVSLDELFYPQHDNPVSIVKMINERNKLGYDKTSFKYKLRQLEEAVLEYRGIWKNGLPIAQFESYEFEDAIPDPNDKVYNSETKRMVAKKILGGSKPALIIKRVLYTDEEVKRKKAEDMEVKRFYEPKLYRLLQWFETEEGQNRIHGKILEQKTTMREDQSKAQSKAEEASEMLAKAKKSYFAVRKRKEAFDDGLEIQFHKFKDADEAREKFSDERELMEQARLKYEKLVAKVDHLRAMVARKPHEWEEWSEDEFKKYVEDKVKKDIVMRRRKIANIQGWRRQWDGFEGTEYEEWRTGKGCQFHPKWMDEIPATASDEDSSFSVGEDPTEAKAGEGKEAESKK